MAVSWHPPTLKWNLIWCPKGRSFEWPMFALKLVFRTKNCLSLWFYVRLFLNQLPVNQRSVLIVIHTSAPRGRPTSGCWSYEPKIGGKLTSQYESQDPTEKKHLLDSCLKPWWQMTLMCQYFSTIMMSLGVSSGHWYCFSCFCSMSMPWRSNYLYQGWNSLLSLSRMSGKSAKFKASSEAMTFCSLPKIIENLWAFLRMSPLHSSDPPGFSGLVRVSLEKTWSFCQKKNDLRNALPRDHEVSLACGSS